MGENLAEPQVNNLKRIYVIIILISVINVVKHYSQVNCPECGEDVADKDKLPMHLKSVHNYSKPFLCDQPCDKPFATKYNLVATQSRRTCLKNCQIVCQFCGDKFGTLVGLKEHHKRGKCDKRYQCRISPKRFDFKIHKQVTHTKGDPGQSENYSPQQPFVIQYVP